MNTFWMVLGQGPPVYRHATEQSARIEAERLARAHPCVPFVVLKAVAECRKSDVAWMELAIRPPDEPPF